MGGGGGGDGVREHLIKIESVFHLMVSSEMRRTHTGSVDARGVSISVNDRQTTRHSGLLVVESVSFSTSRRWCLADIHCQH